MTRFEWDGLRPGDTVYVHRSPEDLRRADPGVVAFVEVRPRVANGVGVRLDDAVVWPNWLAVHRDAVEPRGTCWRCDQGGRS